MATPVANGIVSLQLEAFDGTSWFSQWDSDELGIPMAVRITVTSTGMEFLQELDTSLVTLRTVVPLDRVVAPADLYVLEDETENEDGLGSDDVDASGGAGEDGGSSDGSGGSDSGGSGTRPGGEGGTGPGGIDSGRPGSSGSDGGGGQSGPGSITDPDGNVHKLPN